MGKGEKMWKPGLRYIGLECSEEGNGAQWLICISLFHLP